MRFIDNIHFATHRSRSKFHRIPQRPNLIDPTIRSRIDLKHIKRIAIQNCNTILTRIVRRSRRPKHTLNTPSKNLGSRRLPRPPRPRKQIRMGQPPSRKRSRKRPNNSILANKVRKRPRPPSTIERHPTKVQPNPNPTPPPSPNRPTPRPQSLTSLLWLAHLANQVQRATKTAYEGVAYHDRAGGRGDGVPVGRTSFSRSHGWRE